MRILPFTAAGLVAVLSIPNTRAHAAPAAPVLEVGLSTSWPGKLVLEVDRALAPSPTEKLLAQRVEEVAFLGRGAPVFFAATTYQLWEELHGSSSRRDIPSDRASHENLVAQVHVTYKGAGRVIAELTTTTDAMGDFSPARACRRCPNGILPASLERKSAIVSIPDDPAVDEMQVEWRALDTQTGQGTAPILVSTHRLDVLSGSPVHLYALPNKGGVSAFRLLDGVGLRDGVGAELVYDRWHRSNQVDSLIPPELSTKIERMVLCDEPGGAHPPIYADLGLVVADVKGRYRFDGGAWSPLTPLDHKFPDLAPAVMLPLAYPSTDPAGLSGLYVPASQGHHAVEVAFRYELTVDVDGRNDCDVQGGDTYVRHYARGAKVPVGTVWDAPAVDGTTGWALPIE